MVKQIFLLLQMNRIGIISNNWYILVASGAAERLNENKEISGKLQNFIKLLLLELLLILLSFPLL